MNWGQKRPVCHATWIDQIAVRSINMAMKKTVGNPVIFRIPLAEDARFRALAATLDKTPAELAREMIIAGLRLMP